MRIFVKDETGQGGKAFASVRKACRRALREEGARRDAVLSIALLREDEMAALNRRYTGRDGSTDVLAFPMNEESDEGFILGDLALCPATIKDSRDAYDIQEGRELEFVAVHGVLHLLGYDDQDEEGAALMDKRQREILRMAAEGKCTRP